MQMKHELLCAYGILYCKKKYNDGAVMYAPSVLLEEDATVKAWPEAVKNDVNEEISFFRMLKGKMVNVGYLVHPPPTKIKTFVSWVLIVPHVRYVH